MGTTYSVKLLPPPELFIDANVLQEDIDVALKRFNDIMSTYIEDSELSRLNRASENTWLEVSEPLFAVLSLSQEISEASGGAFDATVGPLVDLWGFGPQKREQRPSDAELAKALDSIGYQNLQLDVGSRRITKKTGIRIDLSAIAKGYGVDVISRLLERKQIVNYMVEIGGEVKIRGRNQRGDTWRIGIERPALGREGSLQALTGDNIAIATSGDYRNYYEKDGVRISHTINPVTGRPIDHVLASVTVIAETCALADAYATALNVLGPEAGYQLAMDKALAAFFIVKDGEDFRVKYTDMFKQHMVN